MAIDAQELAAVFTGGAIGALARAEVVQALPATTGSWPWATFAVNCAGALLLGLFATSLSERPPPSTYRRAFLATGICGGLTTFSTMQLELVRMLERDRLGLALAYTTASIVVGTVGVRLASDFVRRGGAIP